RMGPRLRRRYVYDVAAVRLEEPGDLDRVGGLGATGGPVHGRDAHGDRLVLRPNRAHGIEHVEGKPHPVRERAAVLVAAAVRERGGEARQEIAVREVDLEDV